MYLLIVYHELFFCKKMTILKYIFYFFHEKFSRWLHHNSLDTHYTFVYMYTQVFTYCNITMSHKQTFSFITVVLWNNTVMEAFLLLQKANLSFCTVLYHGGLTVKKKTLWKKKCIILDNMIYIHVTYALKSNVLFRVSLDFS